MVLDVTNAKVHRFREEVDIVVYPIRLIVDAPIRFFHWVISTVSTHQNLIEENAKLRANALLLQSKLQSMLILQKENFHLKRLLQASPVATGKVKVARILAIQMSPLLRQVIINEGENAGVYVGQPVLDGYGVMGQVVAVGPLSSRVLLVDDKRFSIPVQDFRNGLRAVASGVGRSGHMLLVNQMKMSDIKVGDVFMSSGFGLRFPVGYPVGVVSAIDSDPQGHVSVRLNVIAHLSQTQQVLLAWPKQAVLRYEVQQQLRQTALAIGGGNVHDGK